MQYKNMNLCDFCFQRVNPRTVCPNCGLTHDTYKPEAGLLEPGENLLGKYIIGRVLGRGGFGATYLAFSSEREQAVAIKEYFPSGIAHRAKGEQRVSLVSDDKRKIFEKGSKRFFEEAKTMSRFNTNKNVVSVYEFFSWNDTVYYSMEYLKGIDLKGYIAQKGGKLPENEVITIMRSICDALVVVHSTQTLHRDISPDNIYICTDGEIKLIDFGAAKQVVGEYAQQNYSVVIKQGFAPAEQYKSNGRQGVWTDIYAVGASMYYALTGHVPMDAMTRFDNPDISFGSDVHVSNAFADIIKKCLQNKIEDRYQSAVELLGALNALNVGNVRVGGDAFVQGVYNGGDQRTHIEEKSVSFSDNPKSFSGVQTGYAPGSANTQFNPSQYPPGYPQSQYPYSQYPYSQYPNSGLGKSSRESERTGMMKGIIIGVAALVLVVLIVILIVFLTRPVGPPPMGPGGPGMPPPMSQNGGPPPPPPQQPGQAP